VGLSRYIWSLVVDYAKPVIENQIWFMTLCTAPNRAPRASVRWAPEAKPSILAAGWIWGSGYWKNRSAMSRSSFRWHHYSYESPEDVIAGLCQNASLGISSNLSSSLRLRVCRYRCRRFQHPCPLFVLWLFFVPTHYQIPQGHTRSVATCTVIPSARKAVVMKSSMI